MSDASKDDELPFLELNEEIPAQWAVGPESASQKVHPRAPDEAHQVSFPAAQPLNSGFTPTSKVMWGVGAVLILLMITFRVPPALVLLGVFSVLRVLFFPLAILGFILWISRYRR